MNVFDKLFDETIDLQQYIKRMIEQSSCAKEVFLAMIIAAHGYKKIKKSDIRKFVLVEKRTQEGNAISVEYFVEYKK
jgi:hypothetical protein